jgi:hypothetical protein
MTAHNIYKRQTSVPSAGFEPTVPASEHLKTHALDHMATGIGLPKYIVQMLAVTL